MRARITRWGSRGIVLERCWGQPYGIAYGEILTAERRRAGRGLRLHLRTSDPVRVGIRGAALLEAERRFRGMGVRVVDCWGCLLTPTLADFEEALDLEPVRVRQSSDNA